MFTFALPAVKSNGERAPDAARFDIGRLPDTLMPAFCVCIGEPIVVLARALSAPELNVEGAPDLISALPAVTLNVGGAPEVLMLEKPGPFPAGISK